MAAVQPVAAASQPESRILSTATRDESGTWAGHPSKLLGESAPVAAPNKAVTKTTVTKKAVTKSKSKPKTQHYAQRSKTTRAKGARSDNSASL